VGYLLIYGFLIDRKTKLTFDGFTSHAITTQTGGIVRQQLE
jgi:hypothetical protein